jgi:hypothetical protein
LTYMTQVSKSTKFSIFPPGDINWILLL